MALIEAYYRDCKVVVLSVDAFRRITLSAKLSLIISVVFIKFLRFDLSHQMRGQAFLNTTPNCLDYIFSAMKIITSVREIEKFFKQTQL